MLTIKELSLSYGNKRVLDKLSLTLHPSEKLAIVGESGAGKSTLLHYIYQQLKDKSALCSQSQGLVDALSVYHNVYMGGLARHHWVYNIANLVWPMATRQAEVSSLCQALSLDVALTTKVSALSGGQRQRVGLARALYQQQAVFIGDEAFSALDPMMANRLVEQVIAKHDAVVMVLHDRYLALNHFDRIIGLRNGKIALDRPAKQLNEHDLAAFFDNTLDSAATARSHA